MEFSIAGIGCWGPGFDNWDQLQKRILGIDFEYIPSKSPKPDIIPPTERRRAPLPVKLAIESSWQASQAALLEAKSLPSIFTSAHGDTDINDYMCRTLNTDTKPVSPTKFHNSVHNAAAGYWTISTGCTESSNSTAASEYSFSTTLLEGLLQSHSNQKPILLTFFDAPVCDVLKPLLKNEQAFAASIVIIPASNTHQIKALTRFDIEFNQQQTTWPGLMQTELESLYQQCPTAKILSLFEAMCHNHETLIFPTSNHTALTLKFK